MKPPLSDRVWVPLQYVLSELLENALTHGKSYGFKESSVWVAANYYPTSGVVRMAVVDNGCGFLRSLRKHPRVKDDPTDAVAIQAALEPFVSGNPEVGLLDDTSNQGIGLTVSRDIAVAARGYIEVTSGSASLRNSAESTRSHPVPRQGSILDVYMLRSHLLELDIKTHVSKYQQGPSPELRFE